jgi:ribose transport system substrate-binding protein
MFFLPMKTIALPTLLLLFLSWSNSSAVAEDTPNWLKPPLKTPLKEILIGITQNNAGVDSYETTYENSFNAYAKELGIRTVVLDAQGDPAKQINQIRSLIAQKVAVMIVWPTNAKAVVPAVKQAHDAKVPVVITNSEIDPSGEKYTVSFSGPDTLGEGEVAAKLMAQGLNGKGNVVLINGVPGYATAIRREKGFVDTIKKDYPDIKILAEEPGNWNREKAQSVMEDFLTKFGDQINGVYAGDANMGVGALNAIRAAGKAGKIKIVDATLFKDGYDAIKEGVYYASVVQSPVTDAQNAIKVAVQVAEGQSVPESAYFETPAITESNLNQFPVPTF